MSGVLSTLRRWQSLLGFGYYGIDPAGYLGKNFVFKGFKADVFRRNFGLGKGFVVKELVNLYIKGFGKFPDEGERGRPAAAFDLTDIGMGGFAALGDRFLRQTPFFPPFFDIGNKETVDVHILYSMCFPFLSIETLDGYNKLWYVSSMFT